jgi:hypothetical protein
VSAFANCGRAVAQEQEMRGYRRQRSLGGHSPTSNVREAIPERYFAAAFGQMLVPVGPMPISCTMVSPSLAAA